MVKLGGFVGALIGMATSVVFTEVIFPNDQEWPVVLFGVGAAVGWLAGSAVVRRFSHRTARPL